MQPATPVTTPKALYFIGLLCLIPMIGAFVGLVLLLIGIIQYKDKWLTIIGAFGIVFTIVVYSLLFYAANHMDIAKKGWAQLSQMQLNGVVKNIEYYRLAHGAYPDNITQLRDDDKMAQINDPVYGMSTATHYFNYRRKDSCYTVFSSGPDFKPHTADDLYPVVTIIDSSKVGYRRF